MSERPDLRSLLRALDEQYAAVTPRADLEARLLARIRGEAPSPRALVPREARRYARPMILAFGAGAALLMLTNAQRPATAPEVVALEPNVPEPALPEKIRADGGPSDPAPNAHPARRPQVISAPGIRPYPSWPDDKAPWPARPWLSPRSAPRPAASPSGPFFDKDSRAEPWTPADPRPEGRKRALPPGSISLVAPLAQTIGAAPAPAAPQSHASPSSPGRSPSARPAANTPAPAPDTAATEGCRSPDALIDEAASACKAQGLVLADLAYLDACGDGRFRQVEAKCKKDEGEPDPKPAECTGSKLVADDLSCQDPGLFKMQAYTECQAAGLELVDMVFYGDTCLAGLTSMVAYTCCPSPSAPPPPPAPDPCFEGQIGDAKTCQDDAALKLQAHEACLQEGLDLAALKVADDCPGGQSTVGFYVCCKKAP